MGIGPSTEQSGGADLSSSAAPLEGTANSPSPKRNTKATKEEPDNCEELLKPNSEKIKDAPFFSISNWSSFFGLSYSEWDDEPTALKRLDCMDKAAVEAERKAKEAQMAENAADENAVEEDNAEENMEAGTGATAPAIAPLKTAPPASAPLETTPPAIAPLKTAPPAAAPPATAPLALPPAPPTGLAATAGGGKRKRRVTRKKRRVTSE